MLAAVGSVFAALCWVNCVAIEKWEQESGKILPMSIRAARSHKLDAQVSDCTTRWGQRRLHHFCLAIACVALVGGAGFFCAGQITLGALSFAAAISAGLLFVLDHSRLPAFPLRVAADAALLTPLLLLFVR
jgi:hypothetical protein